MADDRQSLPVDLPQLRQIEQDGEDAAVHMARSILSETLSNNGSPDLARLERAGPQVRRIYVQLLARAAAPKKSAASPSSQGTSWGASNRGAKAKATEPASGSGKASASRRATREWKDLRCEPEKAWVLPVLSGMCAAIVVGVVGFIVILVFKL